jgi:hypothetical protein
MPEPRRSRRGEGGAVARSEEAVKDEEASKEPELDVKKKKPKGGKRKKAGGGGKEEGAPAGDLLERETGLEKRLAEHLQVSPSHWIPLRLIFLKLTFSASRRDAACNRVA